MSTVSNRAKGFVSGSDGSAPIDPSEFLQQPGLEWTTRTNVPNFRTLGVVWGNGIWVCVGPTAPFVATSPDGINWTAGTFPGGNNPYRYVCYGNGIFVAIADGGPLVTRIMTSPDGFTWTARAQVLPNVLCQNICFGNGIFVAAALGATNPLDRVLTSTDGINWTIRQVPVGGNVNWSRVVWGVDKFVACSGGSGVGEKIMTSPDGITWTLRTVPASDNAWEGITYGNGLFVCTAIDGTGTRMMTSPDGITWTRIASADDTQRWWDITYGAGLFVAVSNNATGPNTNLIQTSPDGVTWTLRDSKVYAGWNGIAYGNGMFVAAASDTVPPQGIRIITSGQQQVMSLPNRAGRQTGGQNFYGGTQVQTNESKLAAVGGKIAEFFTSAGNVGATPTNVYPFSITANMFRTNGQTIEGTYYGSFSDNASTSKLLALFIGATPVFTYTPPNLNVASNWKLSVTIIRVSNTTLRVGVSFDDTDATNPTIFPVQDVAGLDLAVTAYTLQLLCQSDDPGAADNDVVANMATLYWAREAV